MLESRWRDLLHIRYRDQVVSEYMPPVTVDNWRGLKNLPCSGGTASSFCLSGIVDILPIMTTEGLQDISAIMPKLQILMITVRFYKPLTQKVPDCLLCI